MHSLLRYVYAHCSTALEPPVLVQAPSCVEKLCRCAGSTAPNTCTKFLGTMIISKEHFNVSLTNLKYFYIAQNASRTWILISLSEFDTAHSYATMYQTPLIWIICIVIVSTIHGTASWRFCNTMHQKNSAVNAREMREGHCVALFWGPRSMIEMVFTTFAKCCSEAHSTHVLALRGVEQTTVSCAARIESVSTNT